MENYSIIEEKYQLIENGYLYISARNNIACCTVVIRLH